MDIKHVTIVGPLAPPAGGMANQTKKLSEFLRSEGVDVDIVQVNAPYRPALIGKLPVIRALFRLCFYVFTLFVRLRHTQVVHIMANSGWSWHLFAVPAIWIGRLYGKAVIVNYRGGYARDFFNKSWFWVKPSMKKASAIVVPSIFLARVFDEFGEQAEIIPNVLDETLFYPESFNDCPPSPHIIVTRNLEQIYDVETAIRAFDIVKKKMPTAKLSIAGSGPELVNLQKLVSELAITDVAFTGRLEPEQMAKLYQSADLMMNSSLVDNTPNSIIESLACGTPVVSSNVGGIPDLVQHEHDALLVNQKDASALAAAAMELLTNKEKRVQIRVNGLKTISKFYWRNVWQKLQTQYVQSSTKKGRVHAE